LIPGNAIGWCLINFPGAEQLHRHRFVGPHRGWFATCFLCHDFVGFDLLPIEATYRLKQRNKLDFSLLLWTVIIGKTINRENAQT